MKDIFPGATGSFPTDLTEAGGLVWFLADDGVPITLPDSTQLTATKIYRTDGTAAGTLAAPDINCDPVVDGPVFAPPPGAQWFADLGGSALFPAADQNFDVRLFRFDAPLGCVYAIAGQPRIGAGDAFATLAVAPGALLRVDPLAALHQNFGRHRLQPAALQRRIEGLRVFANRSDVVHGLTLESRASEGAFQ